MKEVKKPRKRLQYRLIAGPTIMASKAEADAPVCCVPQDVECTTLNSMLAEGWVIDQVINHHSAKHDCTVVSFLVKK